jgi:hypothetical protein
MVLRILYGIYIFQYIVYYIALLCTTPLRKYRGRDEIGWVYLHALSAGAYIATLYVMVTRVHPHPHQPGYIPSWWNVRQKSESVATLPPFGPIEGQKWFDQISSQWESQKNRFALIYFGKIQFLPPCIWNIPFMSYRLGNRTLCVLCVPHYCTTHW